MIRPRSPSSRACPASIACAWAGRRPREPCKCTGITLLLQVKISQEGDEHG